MNPFSTRILTLLLHHVLTLISGASCLCRLIGPLSCNFCRLKEEEKGVITVSTNLHALLRGGSIIYTSNYNFEDWGQVFQDNMVAVAIIDRLIHHAKIFYINWWATVFSPSSKRSGYAINIGSSSSFSLSLIFFINMATYFII